MPSETPADTSLAVLSDPRFLDHAPPGFHPERPRRLDAALAGVDRALARGHRRLDLAPREAVRDELERVHDPAWLDRLELSLIHI